MFSYFTPHQTNSHFSSSYRFGFQSESSCVVWVENLDSTSYCPSFKDTLTIFVDIWDLMVGVSRLGLEIDEILMRLYVTGVGHRHILVKNFERRSKLWRFVGHRHIMVEFVWF
ncbi:unnamed protein product [Cochlearia groenlandica]